MVAKSAAELHAEQIVASCTAQFLLKLNAETEGGQFAILAALLADEFHSFNNAHIR